MKKIIFAAIVAITLVGCGHSKQGLSFNPNDGQEAELTMPNGEVVKYTAYEHLYYVKNVEDTAYKYLNVYVPEGASAAIWLPRPAAHRQETPLGVH